MAKYLRKPFIIFKVSPVSLLQLAFAKEEAASQKEERLQRNERNYVTRPCFIMTQNRERKRLKRDLEKTWKVTLFHKFRWKLYKEAFLLDLSDILNTKYRP